MCEFFVAADPILYESRTRTVRIRGVSTSILIVQFHDEILRHRGDVLNFTSFLRVTCLRYLRRKCDQLEAAETVEDAVGGHVPHVRNPQHLPH